MKLEENYGQGPNIKALEADHNSKGRKEEKRKKRKRRTQGTGEKQRGVHIYPSQKNLSNPHARPPPSEYAQK